jgi:hypothetical protein
MPATHDSRVRPQLSSGPAQVHESLGGANARGQVQETIASQWSINATSPADASGNAALEAKYREHARQYFDAMRGEQR